MNFKFKSLLLITSMMMTVTSCMKNQSALNVASEQASQAIGCSNFKSSVYDSMYTYLDSQNEAPDLEDFSEALNEKIDALAYEQKISDQAQIEQLKLSLKNLYSVLLEDAAELKQVKTSREHLETLIEMEMQDISTKANVMLNSKISQKLAEVEEISQSLNVSCTTPTPPTGPEQNPPEDQNQNNESSNNNNTPAQPVAASKFKLYNASLNVLATAYQSCEAIQIAPITLSTPSVDGISRVGTHPDGIGGKREVTSLSRVQQTHPYIRVAGDGRKNGCFNVKSNPLIYDYGGSPAVSNNTLNFFKDSGTGTTELGVDCSAYVSSAVAVAGMRYKPGLDNKAIYVRQNSKKFINAKASGFTCFKNAAMTKQETILPGDIVAISGHVVMVDQISTDPFGIKKLKSASECSSLNFEDFDFVISQSSPSKNGIGLNRYRAKDYLSSGTMREAFESFARSACQAYFSGKSVATESSKFGLLRHLGTPECLAPKVQMANQSCVSQCVL